MKIAEQLYPEAMSRNGYWYGASSYTPIVEYIGNPIIEVIENDYQGTSFFLLKNGGKYGVLTFGWGSCSGCDALQGCNSYQEIDDLIEQMVNSVDWFGSFEDMQAWVNDDDNQQYNSRYHTNEWGQFVDEVNSMS